MTVSTSTSLKSQQQSTRYFLQCPQSLVPKKFPLHNKNCCTTLSFPQNLLWTHSSAVLCSLLINLLRISSSNHSVIVTKCPLWSPRVQAGDIFDCLVLSEAKNISNYCTLVWHRSKADFFSEYFCEKRPKQLHKPAKYLLIITLLLIARSCNRIPNCQKSLCGHSCMSTNWFS